jgi:hypothetical protein
MAIALGGALKSLSVFPIISFFCMVAKNKLSLGFNFACLTGQKSDN